MLGRTLQSAALAAAVPAASVVVLALYLNPALGMRRDAVPLFVSLLMPDLLALTAAFMALALAGKALRWPFVPRPPLPSLPWFTTFALLAVSASACLYWLNVLEYRHSIPVEFLRALSLAALLVSAAALVLLAVAVDAALFPARGRSPAAALVILAPALAVALPLALRPEPEPKPRPAPLATEPIRPARRIVLVGVDGLSPAVLGEGLARGGAPAFARLLKRGAHGPLATLRPTEAPPLWTTVVTGRLPRDHGVKSFATYRLRGSPTPIELLPKGAFVSWLERAGLVTTAPVTSASRRCRAVWNILNAFGVPAGVVRLWGTYPAERVQGFMLSHYFHVLRDDPGRVGDTLFPRELLAEVSARAVRPQEIAPELMAEFVDSSAGPDAFPWQRELVERALSPDLTYQRAGAVLRQAYDPPFFATYVYGLDVVGHAFYRFTHPERFGDVGPEEARRYGRVFDRYLDLVAQWIAEIERSLRDDEVLVVVSTYGMEGLSWWRRLAEAPFGGIRSGTHSGAPDGLLLAVGNGIRPGATVTNASILDVLPTLLYLAGLPVGRDMEGRVLAELLDDDFSSAHPLTYIPSYESLAVAPLPGKPPSDDLPFLPGEEP
jgi:predicted AlkP superfamily phosphohydrolase/phosphomutase